MGKIEFVLPKGVYKEEVTETYGRYVFVPLERGYGITIGNALRRILLSSIPGASIIAVNIDGVLHEFTTIEGIYEDVPQIILNLKKIRVRFEDPEEEKASMYLRAEGQREVKASDLEVPASLKIVTPDVHIATLTSDKARLYMELTVAKGVGYVPADEISKAGFPETTIFIDGLFSPVVRVNTTIENVRVKAKTDYEKLILEIWTDGTVTPDEAFNKASDILHQHVERLFHEVKEPYGRKGPGFEERERIRQILLQDISSLEPSKRTLNCLKEAGIDTIAKLVSKTEQEMLEIKNFGQKSLEEIKEKLQNRDPNLRFGMNVEEYLEEESP